MADDDQDVSLGSDMYPNDDSYDDSSDNQSDESVKIDQMETVAESDKIKANVRDSIRKTSVRERVSANNYDDCTPMFNVESIDRINKTKASGNNSIRKKIVRDSNIVNDAVDHTPTFHVKTDRLPVKNDDDCTPMFDVENIDRRHETKVSDTGEIKADARDIIRKTPGRKHISINKNACCTPTFDITDNNISVKSKAESNREKPTRKELSRDKDSDCAPSFHSEDADRIETQAGKMDNPSQKGSTRARSSVNITEIQVTEQSSQPKRNGATFKPDVHKPTPSKENDGCCCCCS